LLYRKRREVGAIMLAVTGATSFIDWAPTRFLPDTRPFIFFKMPTWLDEQYMWMGLVTLIGFAWILYDFCFPAGHAVAVTRKALQRLAFDPPKDKDADKDAKAPAAEPGAAGAAAATPASPEAAAGSAAPSAKGAGDRSKGKD